MDDNSTPIIIREPNKHNSKKPSWFNFVGLIVFLISVFTLTIYLLQEQKQIVKYIVSGKNADMSKAAHKRFTGGLKPGDMVVVKGVRNSSGLLFDFIQIKMDSQDHKKKLLFQLQSNNQSGADLHHVYCIGNKAGSAWCVYYHDSPGFRGYILSYNAFDEYINTRNFFFRDESGYNESLLSGLSSDATEILATSGTLVNITSETSNHFENPHENELQNCSGATFLDDNTTICQFTQDGENRLKTFNRKSNNNGKTYIETVFGDYPVAPFYRDDFTTPIEISPDKNKAALWVVFEGVTKKHNEEELWLCIWNIRTNKSEKICRFPGNGHTICRNTDFTWHPQSGSPLLAVYFRDSISIVDTEKKRIIRQFGYPHNGISRYPYYVSNPHWSPDGKSIYYIAKDKKFSKKKILNCDLQSGKTEIIDEGDGYCDFFFIK